MTRPTWPADPSPDEAQPDSQQADSAPPSAQPRPTFTPRHQAGPDSQACYPSGAARVAPAANGTVADREHTPPDGGRSRPVHASAAPPDAPHGPARPAAHGRPTSAATISVPMPRAT